MAQEGNKPKRREQRGPHKGRGKLTVKKTLRRCLVMSSHSPFCHLSVKRWKEKKREGKTERKKQIYIKKISSVYDYGQGLRISVCSDLYI